MGGSSESSAYVCMYMKEKKRGHVVVTTAQCYHTHTYMYINMFANKKK